MRKSTKKPHLSASAKIPGVTHIYRLMPQNVMQGIMYMSIAKMTISLMADLEEIHFVGEPIVTVQKYSDCGCTVEKTTIKFLSPSDIDVAEQAAYVISTAAGENFIVGNRESRWPVTEATRSLGSTTEKAVTEYNVTHAARRSLIKCLI